MTTSKNSESDPNSLGVNFSESNEQHEMGKNGLSSVPLADPLVKKIITLLRPSENVSSITFFILLFGVFLLGIDILQMEKFQWLGAPFVLSDFYWKISFYLGVVLTAFGFCKLPPLDPKVDLPRWLAYPLFVIIFAVGFYLRFKWSDEPTSVYWDDHAVGVLIGLNIVDLHKFSLEYPYGTGAIPSTVPLMEAFVWWLFPSLKALLVQRIAENIFGLSALWLAYRLGREISGKRLAGLLLMALMAVSKPMLMLNLCGMSQPVVFFAVSLFLLFQVRLFKKPTLIHFLQWGFVLGIGSIAYLIVYPWIFYLFLITFGWVLWQGRKEAAQWPMFVVFLFALVFFSFFLDRMLNIFHGNFISVMWGGNFNLWIFWQVLFLGIFIYGFRVSNMHGRRLCAWGLGILLAGTLSYRMAISPYGASKIATVSLFPKNFFEIVDVKFFKMIVAQCSIVFSEFFVYSDDRPDMNVYYDPFFDYHAVVFICVGVIAAMVRPSWLKILLFGSVFIGITPRIFTIDAHASKIMSALVPFLLLSAIAVAHLIESSWMNLGKRKWMAIVLAAMVAAFWGWEIKGTYAKTFDKSGFPGWWSVETEEVRLNDQINLDMPDKRIYLVPSPGVRFVSTSVMGILQDRLPLYSYRDVNEINILPNQARKDVVVLISPWSTKVIARLKKEFPSAQWSSVWLTVRSPQLQRLSYRVLIPASAIPKKPGKAFWFNEVPKKTWIRRVYPGYALARAGMILFEDAKPVLNPMDTTIAKEGGDYSLWAEGEWDAPQDGRYDFAIKTPDFTQILVDGKILLDLRPGLDTVGEKHHSIKLKKGPHIINCLSLNKLQFADVIIRNSDLKMVQTLGSK